MNRNKQNPDFLHIGKKLLKWYESHGRDLPFRKTKDPYLIWICEVIFQQTRIQQGLQYYENFVTRFPDVKTLAEAPTDEVLLYWKGLGYYSRAMNIHKAANQIVYDYGGVFPTEYSEILKLKGVGQYTASAISSISFGENRPAVDGNFYRVLSRIFADNFDISSTKAFQYFSELSLLIMPKGKAGDFNQAMMDLGSEICKPKNPLCQECPISKDCIAFGIDKIADFPVKLKKMVAKDLDLSYYFVEFDHQFLVKRRGTDFIWKNLYEFPVAIPDKLEDSIYNSVTVKHKLTHLNLTLSIYSVKMSSQEDFLEFAKSGDFSVMDEDLALKKSFPKPLQNFIEKRFKSS